MNVNNSLESLDLSGNNIGSHVQAIANGLRLLSHSLTNLNLRNTSLQGKGIFAILQALKFNEHLSGSIKGDDRICEGNSYSTVLDLSDNKFDKPSNAMLVEWIAYVV